MKVHAAPDAFPSLTGPSENISANKAVEAIARYLHRIGSKDMPDDRIVQPDR
jgi:hypothetical protein